MTLADDEMVDVVTIHLPMAVGFVVRIIAAVVAEEPDAVVGVAFDDRGEPENAITLRVRVRGVEQ